LNKRSKAALNIAREVLLSGLPDIHELYGSSTVLSEKMPRDVKYYLGVEKRLASFALGTVATTGDPLRLLVLYRDSLGENLGLRAGDRVLSAGGAKFDADNSLEDLKAVIMESLGRTIDLVVEREGEETTLKMDIPEEIPENYLLPSTLEKSGF
jgi:S1-C subfamily serine protease